MIRVLVVDDSAIVRKVLSEQLSKCPDIEVVGTAVDPFVARDLIVRLRPDVITLDLEMPRMDGLSFLSKLMRHFPMPVVVVSSLTPKHSEAALRALELGAVEVICKPSSAAATADLARPLARAVRAAAGSRPSPLLLSATVPREAQATIGGGEGPLAARQILALGASTGGTSALATVLSGLPASAPGTLIVQHMPESFTAAFAARLDSLSSLEVREARDRDPVVRGTALLAPGNKHLVVERSGANYRARLRDGPAIHHQRPAVDPLFESVAASAGPQAVGVLLTGMGSDGALGLLAMRQQGSRTLAQDEKTSIVFGMPREAIRLRAAEEVVPLPQMAATILRAFQRGGESRAA